jgi:hypothetical protein
MTRSANAPIGVATWSTEAWRAKAIAWIDERLAVAGIARTGAVAQPRIRPWATVLAIPTDRGRYWLKAAAPATAFEVALYPILHRHAPNAALTPLAVDEARGWLLIPDGGSPLADGSTGDALVDALATVLPRYAELQRALACEVEAMLAIGVPDMRPERLPGRFEEALEVAGRYVEEHGSEEDRVTLARIAATRGTVAMWCERLATSPVPPTLDHNDLSPWNVLVPSADRVAEARFYDWGDSVVAHPFTSMLVTLRVMRHLLQCRLDDPRLLRLRDAYLEPFGELGTRAELVGTLEVACHTGKIARSLNWHRTVGMLPPEDAGEDASAPFEWLAELLDASYLGMGED